MTSDPPGFLVTGGTGFIGSALVRRLKTRFGTNTRVVALGSDCNLETPSAFETLQSIGASFPCDHILHLAARAPSGAWLADHPAEAWYSNTLINATLFEAAQRFFPKAKVTTVLSYSMYPPGPQARREDEVGFTGPEDNLAAYANAKTAVLAAQDAYRAQYGLRSGSVVLPTVYGPNPDMPAYRHAVPSLCRKFLDATRGVTPRVDLWGDGHQERDFLFLENATDGIIASALRQESGLVNLGSGQHTSIRSLAALIARLTGYSGDITFDEDQYSGPQRRWLNIERAKSELGWQPTTSLECGISQLLQDIETRLDAKP